MKVLIIQEFIPHYRISFFNALKKNLNGKLVVTSIRDSLDSYQFDHVKIEVKKSFGLEYTYLPKSLDYTSFDAIILPFNLRSVLIWSYLLKQPLNTKIILWGIGLSSDSGLGKRSYLDKLRFYLAKKADAILFYSSFPVDTYLKAGIKNEKIYVANNTFEQEVIPLDIEKKRHLLFIGSLKKYKKIEILIEVFNDIINQIPDDINLNIVGGGEMMEEATSQVEDLDLSSRVSLHGQITDQNKLNHYFLQSFACVSPGQAGLAVLQCFSKGVPFITQKNAITGGERFNIQHGVNGYFYEDKKELASLLIKLCNDRSLWEPLGRNAQSHYVNNCSLEQMVDTFLQAIESNHK